MGECRVLESYTVVVIVASKRAKWVNKRQDLFPALGLIETRLTAALNSSDTGVTDVRVGAHPRFLRERRKVCYS